MQLLVPVEILNRWDVERYFIVVENLSGYTEGPLTRPEKSLTRPEKSLHFLVNSPDSNLHFLVSPEIALHLITG